MNGNTDAPAHIKRMPRSTSGWRRPTAAGGCSSADCSVTGADGPRRSEAGAHRRGALARGHHHEGEIAARQHEAHAHADVAAQERLVGDAADPGELALYPAGIAHRLVGGDNALVAKAARDA